MTEKDKRDKIEEYRKRILNEAEEIADELEEDGDVDYIFEAAQYIISAYANLETWRRALKENESIQA